MGSDTLSELSQIIGCQLVLWRVAWLGGGGEP